MQHRSDVFDDDLFAPLGGDFGIGNVLLGVKVDLRSEAAKRTRLAKQGSPQLHASRYLRSAIAVGDGNLLHGGSRHEEALSMDCFAPNEKQT